MIDVLLFILSSLILPVMLSVLADFSPRLASRIINWAARRLGSASATARYSEEWASELAETPGQLSKLGLALQKILYLPRIIRAVQGSSERLEKELRAEHELIRDQIIASAWMFTDTLLRHFNEYDRKELENIASHGHMTAHQMIFDLVQSGMTQRYWNLRATDPDFMLPKPGTKKWVDEWILQLADMEDLARIRNLPIFRRRA